MAPTEYSNDYNLITTPMCSRNVYLLYLLKEVRLVLEMAFDCDQTDWVPEIVVWKLSGSPGT